MTLVENHATSGEKMFMVRVYFFYQISMNASLIKLMPVTQTIKFVITLMVDTSVPVYLVLENMEMDVSVKLEIKKKDLCET